MGTMFGLKIEGWFFFFGSSCLTEPVERENHFDIDISLVRFRKNSIACILN